jgi:hypothetical protein
VVHRRSIVVQPRDAAQFEKRIEDGKLGRMKDGRFLRRAQATMVDLPIAVRRRLPRKNLKRGLRGFKGDDFAAIPVGSKGFAELANVRSHIDHRVDFAIFDEIHQVPDSPPPEMDDSEAFISSPYHAIQ